MDRSEQIEFPIVVNTIDLNTEDTRRYRRAHRINAGIRRRLSELLQSMMEEQLQGEIDVWDELSVRFGYCDLDALQADDCAMTVSWRTGTVTLRRKQEEDKENDDVSR